MKCHLNQKNLITKIKVYQGLTLSGTSIDPNTSLKTFWSPIFNKIKAKLEALMMKKILKSSWRLVRSLKKWWGIPLKIWVKLWKKQRKIRPPKKNTMTMTFNQVSNIRNPKIKSLKTNSLNSKKSWCLVSKKGLKRDLTWVNSK